MNPFNLPIPTFDDLRTTLYPATSRYFGVEIRKLPLDGDRRVAYLARRFVPQQDRFDLLEEHTVVEGDRPDNLAARYLGDPEQFWRLADANNDLDPFDLTETVNRRLRITLPEGIPASPVQ